jgi:hypothetical protein
MIKDHWALLFQFLPKKLATELIGMLINEHQIKIARSLPDYY